MKVFSFLFEPAEYTLDLVEHIYRPRGVAWGFLRHTSSASNRLDAGPVCLEGWPFYTKAKYMCNVLRNNDIIVMNGYATSEFLILFALNLYFRKPLAIESDTQLRVPVQWTKRIIKWIYLSVIFRNPRVSGWAGGNFSHKELFSHYGMCSGRIHLMPMMIDVSRYLRAIPDFCGSTSPFRIIYLGRLVKVKGLDLLLQAFLRLAQEDKEVELHIVGGGALESKLRRRVDGERRVHFHGSLFGDEKTRVLWQCQVLVLPSKSESWGLVVNEAMAAGVPVIVSDAVGACTDLVGESGSGLIFPSGDEDALLGCMREMISNTAKYQERAVKAQQYMEKIWNYDLYGRCFDQAVAHAANL